MKRVHGFLLRFIDLGLLLLMAFLVVAELNPTHEVAMPGRPGDNTTTEGLQHYRITFDEALRMEVQERPGALSLTLLLFGGLWLGAGWVQLTRHSPKVRTLLVEDGFGHGGVQLQFGATQIDAFTCCQRGHKPYWSSTQASG